MTINTQELRRLYGAATAGFFVDKRAFSTALHNAAPALLDAADRLARIEAVMAGDEAVEVVSLALSCSGLDDVEAADYLATAALAALRELIA